MNKVSKKGLVAGLISILLIAIMVLATGCFPAATTTAATGENGEAVPPSFWSQYGMIFFLVAIFAIFYFVMIRPQRKRQKEQQAMVAALQKGDKVMTIGGIYGTIDSINETTIILKVEGGTTLKVARTAVNPVKEPSQTTR
jgi:preprotein translocase subunit YajC